MPLDQPPSTSQMFGHEVRMTFGEHLEDLRRRLILALAGVLLAALITFTPWVAFGIIGWLAQPFVQVLDLMGFPAQTYGRDTTLGFGIYLQVGLISALILAGPWVIYQAWRFVVEGLYEHERRTVHILAPFSTAMTVLAILFTRYILLPMTLAFFVRFTTWFPEVQPGEPEWIIRQLMSDRMPSEKLPIEAMPAADLPRLPVVEEDPVAPAEGTVWINRRDGKMKSFFSGRVHVLSLASPRIFQPLPDLRDYIGFATFLGLGNVIAFQMPVVMLVLGWTKLVDPRELGKMRKYAFFACAVLAALITPGDVSSMLVMLAPLYALFELGLLAMRWSYSASPATSASRPDGDD